MTEGVRFSDPDWTASGEPRASVPFTGLRTLWFNTGTLCNITCEGCYIESSPTNDRLAYLSLDEVCGILDEAARLHPELRCVAFTGGEPFMNRDLLAMLRLALATGYEVLVLTNAMRPMRRFEAGLLALRRDFPERLTVRVSLDHHRRECHESLRGPATWAPALDGLRWLAASGFRVAVAGRTLWDEDEASLRSGFAALFAEQGITLDANDPGDLVLFPEMEHRRIVPEITDACWGILGKHPDQVMCADQRMVIKRRGADRPALVSCTLLPYAPEFELGATLAEAARAIKLNHRFCAEFCVLGGGSCRS